jgi:hypothetical protein
LDEKPDEVRFECVKKQPYLTGFPRTVFATVKRWLQARIRTQSAEIQSQSLSGYSVLFDSILPADFMQNICFHSASKFFPSKIFLSFCHFDLFLERKSV